MPATATAARTARSDAHGAERETPLTAALERVAELCARFSITRVGETTRLHRIGLPTMCAVVPDSRDDVSIYNGRGLTREEALIGAVMEAVERQSAAYCTIPSRSARADRVRGIDLAACGMREQFAGAELEFVAAHDLLHDERVEVPKALVQMPWNGAPVFPTTHTNGLAAGFTFNEAVYHALLELVERHLYAVTHARAHLRPKRILQRICGDGEYRFVDDPVHVIAQPTGVPIVDSTLAMFAAAGVTVRLVGLHSPPLPPAVLAGLYDPERGDFRAGFGCSWSPVAAVIRSLTECAQAGVADVQGARENILRADDPPSPFTNNTRRRTTLPFGRWYFDGPAIPVNLRDLPDESRPSLAANLHALIDAVGTIASRIAVVDLSPRDHSFFVVRAIVPELETMLIDGRVGSIAQAIVNARA